MLCNFSRLCSTCYALIDKKLTQSFEMHIQCTLRMNLVHANNLLYPLITGSYLTFSIIKLTAYIKEENLHSSGTLIYCTHSVNFCDWLLCAFMIVFYITLHNQVCFKCITVLLASTLKVNVWIFSLLLLGHAHSTQN
jgi:hypothetical protein